jgi:hypothetical protein
MKDYSVVYRFNYPVFKCGSKTAYFIQSMLSFIPLYLPAKIVFIFATELTVSTEVKLFLLP